MKKFMLPLLFVLTGFTAICQNPFMLKDVYPGITGSGIQQIVKTSNYTFFNAEDDDPDADRGLYRTDGTSAGTMKLNLSYPGYISTKAEKLTALGNKIIFAGDNFPNYGEIWASDGTQSGTMAIERFQPTTPNVSPIIELTAMGSYAYYSAVNSSNQAILKRTDGTVGGTSEIYNFGSYTGIPQVVFLTPLNSILYFIVYDQFGIGVDQLWRSDGTTAGTYMVHNFGTTQYVASYIMPAGNNLYIMTVVPGTGNVLWKSDGTAAGSMNVKTIASSGNNNYPSFGVIGSTLYFAGLDANGKELWKTDGTAAGTVMAADINTGAASSNPLFMTALNNNLYFSATTVAEGNELWKYDGISASLVKDINPGNANSVPGPFAITNNTIVFRATTITHGAELWISDGTSINTVEVADINPGAAGSGAQLFTEGDPVYFFATNGINGGEIFKYDNSEGISGLHKIYVNDNSTAADVFTTAVGNNSNPGTRAAPVATMSYALSLATAGDTIVVDAGTYIEQVTIDKGITIMGAGRDLTSVLCPPVTVPPPGTFFEQGVFQTAQNMADVHIKDIAVTGVPTGITPVILQTGGSVKNCRLQNGNQGVFIRVEATVKTVVVENNIIDAEYIGVNFAGTGLSASLFNNTITANNAGFSAGLFAGLDFGALPSLFVIGNFISNYSTSGMQVNSLNATIIENSIVGAGGFAIQRLGGNAPYAACNWYGSANQQIVVPKISGSMTYSPWLTSETDNNPATPGFQPVPGTCTGRQNKFYVNDNSQTGDVFTTAIGNDGNNGLSSAPLATISAAYTRAQAGDSIFVDAGTHLSGGTVAKAITVVGTNYLISPNDIADPLLPNTGRNAESIIINSTFTIGASNISFTGLCFDPGARTTFLQNNNTLDFSNINFSNNKFLISNIQTVINLTGRNIAPLSSGNYTINNNRFEKGGGASATTVQLHFLNNVAITNNAFVLTTPAFATLQTGIIIGSSTTGKVDNLLIDNNVFDGPNAPVNTVKVGTCTITNNKSYRGRLGFTLSNSIPEPAIMTIRNNLITNIQLNGAIFYSRSNATDNSSPNRFICEGNNINFDVTGQTSGSSFVIASSFSTTVPLTTGMETIIKKNRVNYTGDFSLVTNVFSMSGLRLAGRHTYIQIDSNEVDLSCSNMPSSVSSSTTGILIFSNPGNLINIIPSNGIINIASNKINGYKQSLGFLDAVNGVYGGLATGINAHVNNNSFTGDSISINNGTTSQAINAFCNWYGSSAAQNVIPKIASAATINYVPWLTNGTDNDIAIGFQPVPGSCTGTSVTVAVISSTNVNCNGANNGAIDVNVSGGTAPYTFAWTKDNVAGFSAVEDLTGIGGGTYQLTITDANGSAASTTAVIITEPAALTASPAGTNVSCFGGSNGSATVTAGGGTAPYTYLWNNAATTSSITGLVQGNYSVVVTDANGCTANAAYLVTQPAVLTVAMSGTVASCNGSATATPAGGTAPYTYSWNNGGTTQTISPVPAGTYTVIVTDTKGCTVNGTYTITGNSPINPNTTLVNVSCFGTSTGSITVTSAGGIAPRTYNLNGGAFQSGNVFPNLPAGTYLVGVRDAVGCADFVSRTITQPILLTVVLDNAIQPCGNANNGRINITATGGTGAKTYSWTGPNSYSSNTQDPINLFGGIYNLTVTDARGCTALLQVNLAALPQASISEVITHVDCRGNFTGAIDATVTGGSGTGFTYFWTLPGGFNASTEDITGLRSGNHTLVVTDNANGCTFSKTIVVNQPAANLSLATVKTNVNGCISMGTITGTASGGTSPYQYSLDAVNYQPSGLFTNVAGGNYTVYTRDANGCTATKAISVTDNGSDQYEGNNSKNQAKVINTGENISARIALASDPADWFRFTTTAGAGNYTLSLSHPSVSYTFNLYATGNNTAALVPVSTTATTKVYTLANNTVYYISITGGLSYSCYSLSVTDPLFTLPVTITEPGPAKLITPLPEVMTTHVYPNPHQGAFRLSIASPENGMARIELYTLAGQKLLEKTVPVQKGENIVPFTGIAPGTIFYRIQVGKHITNGKLIGTN